LADLKKLKQKKKHPFVQLADLKKLF